MSARGVTPDEATLLGKAREGSTWNGLGNSEVHGMANDRGERFSPSRHALREMCPPVLARLTKWWCAKLMVRFAPHSQARVMAMMTYVS